MRYLAIALLVAIAVGVGVVVGVLLFDSDDTTSPTASKASPVATPPVTQTTSVPTAGPPATPAPTSPPTAGPTAEATIDIDALDLLATALAGTPEQTDTPPQFYLSQYSNVQSQSVEPCGVVVAWTAWGNRGDRHEVWRTEVGAEFQIWAQIHTETVGQPGTYSGEYIDRPGVGTWTYRVAAQNSTGGQVWSHEEEITIDNPGCTS